MQIQKNIITRLQDYTAYKTVLNDCQVYYDVQIRYYIKYYMKNTIKSMIHCYMDMYVFCTETNLTWILMTFKWSVIISLLSNEHITTWVFKSYIKGNSSV